MRTRRVTSGTSPRCRARSRRACRFSRFVAGCKFSTVALGGTLRLDIPNHDDNKYDNVQALRYAPDAAIQIPQVNSSHHQAIDRLGKGLRVEAWCQADDVIEQARLVDYPYCRGVQYHPERDEIYRPLFDSFAEQVMREPAWV